MANRLAAGSIPGLTILSLAVGTIWMAGTGEVDAASVQGRATATVIAPTVVSTSFNIVVSMPAVTGRVGTSSASTPAPAATSASVTSTSAGDTTTVAGVSVTPLEGGTAYSFSVGGDTTSSYVVELPSATSAASSAAASLAPASSAASDATAPGAAIALPTGSAGLILAAQPLTGGGRLSIVISQAPSDVVPGAVSLSVNYN
ncbi:MAG: hypothetical protein JWP36_2511 [Paucimonas sp.]|nr:hypothetical protein [Paucimonas sp.]